MAITIYARKLKLSKPSRVPKLLISGAQLINPSQNHTNAKARHFKDIFMREQTECPLIPIFNVITICCCI